MDKKNRILAILYRLLYGEKLTVASMADFYQVSAKSIVRDISEIRTFLSDNRELVHNAELIYDNRERYYRLDAKKLMEAEDLLCIFKIIYGSRAIDKESIFKLLQCLSPDAGEGGSELLLRDYKNEMEYYHTVMTGSFQEIRDKVWKLQNMIGKGKEICISYKRLDGKSVIRSLYPIAVSFSNFYFYLLACRADKEDTTVLFYRLDRIVEMKESSRRMPLSIEERHRLEYVKLYSQNMFNGERIKIRFRYTGPSLPAILDRFPTAEILHQNEKGAELSAMVEYSRGTVMELLSQGSWVKVLSPERLVEDVKKELERMLKEYRAI